MPHRRRTRYTATFANGKRAVVLAYDRQDAIRHFTDSGRNPVEVVKGDYRAQEKAAAPGERWAIDGEALKRALDTLGIRSPVNIRRDNRRTIGTYGSHIMTPVGGSSYVRNGKLYFGSTATHVQHDITIKGWLSTEQAGRTLWHELTHAMQNDRVFQRVGDPSKALLEWHASYRDGTPYSDKPAEIEAREMEAMHDVMPLTRRV